MTKICVNINFYTIQFVVYASYFTETKAFMIKFIFYLNQSCILFEPVVFRLIFDFGLKCSRESARVCGNENKVNKSYVECISA